MSLLYQNVKAVSVLLLTLVIAATVLWYPGVAQQSLSEPRTFLQEVKLTPPDTSQVPGNYGESVALSADGLTMLVGSIAETGIEAITGAAHILRFDGANWIEQAKLFAADGVQGDYFGFSVALSADGNIAVIGTPFTTNTGGAVYIFAYDGSNWIQRDKIVSSTPDQAEGFGYSVALDDSGTRLLVGSPFTSEYIGQAEIFNYNDSAWLNEAILHYETPVEHQFGRSVALSASGTTAVVGTAMYTLPSTHDAVIVFRYEGSSWAQQAVLMPEIATSYIDTFGASVDVSDDGNRVVVGAPLDQTLRPGNGAAYVFDFVGSGWSETIKLYNAYPKRKDRFGYSVSISGDGSTLLVGAPYDNDPLKNQGTVSTFKLIGGNWQPWNVLRASDPKIEANFGSATELSTNGEVALVGAPRANAPDNIATGAVYVFVDYLDLIINGSFETAANTIPTGWIGKNLSSDKHKCNEDGKTPIAYDGACAFVFKGSENESSKLFQEVNLAEIDAGDVLTLYGYVYAKGTVEAKAKVRVTYTDTTLTKSKIVLNIPGATEGYVAFDTLSSNIGLILAGTPQNVRVQFQNRGGSGKVVFDAVSLSLTSGSEISGRLIPVPQPQMRLDTRDS